MFFYNLNATYEHACMENPKDKYWTKMYDTITNYNDQNHTPLSNEKIREAIHKLTLKEQAEANNVTVDMFSTQRKKSEDLIIKAVNLTISNKSGNGLIDKVANLKINKVVKNLIKKSANMTINEVRNILNGENASDVQVQFAGDSDRILHQIYWAAGISELYTRKSLCCLLLRKKLLAWTINWIWPHVLGLYRCHMHSRRLRHKNSSWTRLRTTRDQTGILGELSGLALMELTQLPLAVELVLRISVTVQPHPLIASRRVALEIYDKLLPQFSGIPVNWTPPLTEDWSMVLFCCLSGVRYWVMNYLTVTVGISTCAVGWTLQLSPYNPWDQNSWDMGSITLTDWMKMMGSGSLLLEPERRQNQPQERTWAYFRENNRAFRHSGRL